MCSKAKTSNKVALRYKTKLDYLNNSNTILIHNRKAQIKTVLLPSSSQFKNMVILLSGASHTGKTALAQEVLKKYQYPYLSIDHLKMGLIRSGQTKLTVYDDELLLAYLWDIVKEIIKTAIENEQNLVIEGCYIPFDWNKYFDEDYLKNIKCLFIVMSENYIESHYLDISAYANCIENRLGKPPTKEYLIKDNKAVLQGCKEHLCNYFLIDKDYPATDTLINKIMQN